MIIKKVIVGKIQENCYITGDKNELLVIDPGAEPEKIMKQVEEIGGKVKYIVLTHCHYDHIGAIRDISEQTDALLVVPKAENENYLSKKISLERYFGNGSEHLTPDILLNDGDVIMSGEYEFKMLQTPGHTSGSACYLCDNALFSGDILFYRSIGRTDLPTGDFFSLINSVKNILYKLPDETEVYPGHGEMTNIASEKRENDYI